MTMTEISGMLDKAIADVSAMKVALDSAKKKYDDTISKAEKEYNTAATSYDVALEKVQTLRAQLNGELEKLVPSNPRVRTSAPVTA